MNALSLFCLGLISKGLQRKSFVRLTLEQANILHNCNPRYRSHSRKSEKIVLLGCTYRRILYMEQEKNKYRFSIFLI